MFILFLLLLLTIPVPGQAGNVLDRVDSLLQKGMIGEAESIMRSFHTELINPGRSAYFKGIIALRKGDYDASIRHLEKSVGSGYEEAEAYFALSNAYGYKAANAGIIGSIRATLQMRDLLEKTVDADPAHQDAKLLLFQFYLQTPGILGGNREKARRYAESILPADSSLGHYLLALYWEREENKTLTEKELLYSLESDPENVNVLNHLGYFYLSQRDIVNSMEYFSRAIEVAPETANVYDSMGDCFAVVAEYDSALAYYEKALERDSTFTVSLYNKARILEALGKRDEAMRVYRSLAAHFPGNFYGRQARQRIRELD